MIEDEQVPILRYLALAIFIVGFVAVCFVGSAL